MTGSPAGSIPRRVGDLVSKADRVLGRQDGAWDRRWAGGRCCAVRFANRRLRDEALPRVVCPAASLGGWLTLDDGNDTFSKEFGVQSKLVDRYWRRSASSLVLLMSMTGVAAALPPAELILEVSDPDGRAVTSAAVGLECPSPPVATVTSGSQGGTMPAA